MKKSVKITLWILFIIIIAWAVIFTVDYSKVSRLKKPFFVIEIGKVDGETSATVYMGLGYKVYVEEANIVVDNKEERCLTKTEMYILDRCVVGAIADLAENDAEPNQENENKEKDNLGITTVMTLEDNIQEDSIWCGTFQLIWNDLKNDLAKQDIVFDPQLDVVENLNKETFKVEDLSEQYFYKKIGNPTYELKNEIEKAIKSKFNEKSDILEDFYWSEKNEEDYFLYVMLKKQFEFEKAFEEMENGEFGETGAASYFGIKESSDSDELRNQASVLYYNSKEDFAIVLKTKGEDEVIICKNPSGTNFNEIYKNIEKQTESYEGATILEKGELLKVPNIKLKEKTEFKEIQEKPFNFANGASYFISKAIQTIEFELDKTGGKIKSEAGMMINKSAARIPEKLREFVVDDTFAIFLKEEGKETPYFAGKIDDITKFQ